MDGSATRSPATSPGIEDDGTITLLGRGNTCVNTGGEKVFPEEVEGALKSHPDVFDALVIGVPDERLGQRVAALVQPRPGAAPDLGALEEHLRGHDRRLQGAAQRSGWSSRSARTATGKADYRWAREYAGDPPSRPWTTAAE